MRRDAASFTRAITTKVTEAEFKQLEQLWSASGITRSEWCRKALLLTLRHRRENGISPGQRQKRKA